MKAAAATHSRLRRPLMCLPALGLLLINPVSAASLIGAINLGGSQQETTVWDNLTNTNPTSVPTSGTGQISTTTNAFPGSYGFYSFSADYTVTAIQPATFDIASVVWQVEAAPTPGAVWPYSGGPKLTVTTSAGVQILNPVAYRVGPSEDRMNFGTDPVTYSSFAWQWNLSTIDDEILSVELSALIPVHTSFSGSRIDVANSFVQVVPEPSALLLGAAALPLAFRRRRTSLN